MKPEKRPVVEEFFGTKLTDNYRWMEDAKNPEVLSWVAEQNGRTDQWFAGKGIEEKIRELKEKEPERKLTFIERCKDGFVAAGTKGGVPVIISLDQELQNEQVILARYDIEHLTPVMVSVSPYDDRYVLVQCMLDGDNKITFVCMDRITKTVLKRIDSVWFGTWSARLPVFYCVHTCYDENSRLTTLKVIAYNILNGEEKTVYEENGTAGLAMLYHIPDKPYIFAEIWDDFSNWRYAVIEEETGKSYLLNKEAQQLKYAGTINDEHYFISKKLSETGTLLAVREGDTLEEPRVVREADSDMLEDGFAMGGSIYLLGKRNVASVLLKITDGKETEIPLPDAVGTASLLSCTKKEAVIKFESFTRPVCLGLTGKDSRRCIRQGERTMIIL